MTHGKFSSNNRKKVFIDSIPTSSIVNSKLSRRSKFNFSFFDGSQEAGAGVESMSATELQVLLEKLRLFSKEPLSYWTHERCGGGGLKVLEVYGQFPKRSDFTHPKHVPHDALWARFRLDNMTRLIGFVVSNEIDGTFDQEDGFRFDKNTFYVVFIDPDHRFYKTEKK